MVQVALGGLPQPVYVETSLEGAAVVYVDPSMFARAGSAALPVLFHGSGPRATALEGGSSAASHVRAGSEAAAALPGAKPTRARRATGVLRSWTLEEKARLRALVEANPSQPPKGAQFDAFAEQLNAWARATGVRGSDRTGRAVEQHWKLYLREEASAAAVDRPAVPPRATQATLSARGDAEDRLIAEQMLREEAEARAVEAARGAEIAARQRASLARNVTLQVAARYLPRHSLGRLEREVETATAREPYALGVPRLIAPATCRLLGEGTFGAVHGSNLPDGTPIAVKRPKSGASHSFTDEVCLMLDLRHPNVVQALGLAAGGGLVMEACELGTLDGLIKAGEQSLPLVETARGIARGLAYLHMRGVFHCDLKPANILVASSLAPKIADFGLSVTRPTTSLLDADIEAARPRGSCTFRAPEVLHGGASGWRRYRLAPADVWSLGCVLACLGGGSRYVYPQATTSEAVRAAEEEVAAGRLRPSLTPGNPLAAAVARASVREPASRTTAQALALALVQ